MRLAKIVATTWLGLSSLSLISSGIIANYYSENSEMHHLAVLGISASLLSALPPITYFAFKSPNNSCIDNYIKRH